jgi:hypothetical protein
MQDIYAVMAYSPSRNERQRVFHEDALTTGQHQTNLNEAHMQAQSLADYLNRVREQPNDWQPLVELIPGNERVPNL